MLTSIVETLKVIHSSKSILKEAEKLDTIIKKYNQLKNKTNIIEDHNYQVINELMSKIKVKLKVEKQNKSNVIKEKKEILVKKLEELIKNEKNIGKAFAELKIIQERWAELSKKTFPEQKDIDKKFTKRIEDFYYNINIYKAIQEHDLKRNQQLKQIILNKLEKLVLKPPSKELISEIKRIREEWESLGPVKKDLQDDFWSKYRNLLDKLYSNFERFKIAQKDEQIINLNNKKSIVDYIRQINTSNLKDSKEWKSTSKKVIKKQEEWNSIGFVPKESKIELWTSYRSACDTFFDAKKVFFDQQKEAFKFNKHLKTGLCKKAEKLLQNDNLNELTKEFVQMQSEWKKIGSVQQRDEQYLWHRFQNACNTFFEKKKEYKKRIDSEKDTINYEKEDIIKSLKNTSIESEKQLLEHLSNWWKTNRIHTVKSEQLEDTFQKILESKLMNKSTLEFEGENLKTKIEIYSKFKDGGKMILKETRKIKDKMTDLKKNISQYENNLSFFDDSKGSEALKKDVYSKIELLKNQVKDLKTQLNLITKHLKQ